MIGKRYLKTGICLVVTSAMLLTGCSSTPTEVSPSETQLQSTASADTTINVNSGSNDTISLDSLREKYGDTTVDYADDIMTLERAEKLEFSLDFNPNAKENFDVRDYITIYQDEDLKYKLSCSYDYNQDTKKLVIEPPTFGVAEIFAPTGGSTSLDGLSGSYLYDDNTCDNWGNLKQLYLVQKCDATTGETLDKPIVHIVKIKSELKQAPKVRFSSNADGEAVISWDEVKGATEYILFTVNKTEQDGYNSFTSAFGRTTDTTWTAPNMGDDDGSSASLMNEMFRNFITSDDDLAGGMENMNGDYFETMPNYIGVIAVTDTGASPISNLYPVNQYAKQLPNCQAYTANDADVDTLYRESITSLPAEAYVTMCDGSTSPRILDYDFDNASLKEAALFTELHIKAQISGTKFFKEYTVALKDTSHVQEDLDTLKKRQEGLKNKGGSVEQDVDIEDEETPETTPAQSTNPTQTEAPTQTAAPEQTAAPKQTAAPEQTQKPDNTLTGNTTLKVTANSALSEYIARTLLNSAKTVDISSFTESMNTNTVVDAVQEAQLQNPLSLGIKNATYDEVNHILHFEYYNSTETLNEKRNAVIKKSKEIIGQIIKDGMSDLDKEMAINEYLCANATYDDAALENAKKYDYKTVDDEFQDSFTPYGTLVKGVGVCASYAGSFKVLADEAGLESIVVTGTLNGNLSHAWNRVKIDNEWKTIDTTNNDNEIISNALFNISDKGINGVLTADKRYVMDENLSDYTCKSDDKEYYHYTSKYFAKDDIANQFIKTLEKDNQSVLRTEYTITDEEFSTIAQSVAQQMKTTLKGYYWLGVINLTK